MDRKPKRSKRNNVKGVRDSNQNPYPSFGRDRHAQQVAPGRHQETACKLDTKKTILRIGTWNVRTLYQKGKVDNVSQEMNRMNLNILGLSEVRWKGAGSTKIDSKTLIYSGGDEHIRGVGILFDETASKSLKSWCPISDRVVVAKIEAKPLNLGIIQVYAPTSESTDEEVEKFYEEIERAKSHLKSQDIKIIMGDFNAKVGDERVEDVVGPCGLGTLNERGSRLIDWCEMNNFFITNTWFENHHRRQWTWMSPGDRIRNKIDYILVQKRYRNAVKTSKSLPGADCDSDHIPVMCKFELKLKRVKKTKAHPKFQMDLLRSDTNLREQISVAIQNRYEVLSNITEVEELWLKMKESLKEVMEEHIPKKDTKVHKKWMNSQILDLMEERRKLKNDEAEYKILNKKIRRECNAAKEEWINRQCQEIEQNQCKDSKYIHTKINEVSGRNIKCNNPGCIKSKDGTMLMEKEEILNRWSEYVEDLFSDNRGTKPEIKKKIEGPCILKEEVKAALKKMKNGKASGPDNIPTEIITALEDLGIDMTTKLLNAIYDSGTIPEDLCKSVFIALPKKPGATECELHRTISLMSHFTKILLRVLMHRMRKSLRPEISTKQFGFVRDKGTRNAIFTLSMLMERCIEVQKDLYLCFIDYSKAFDKVKHERLFGMLENLDIDGKDLRVIRNLYWDQTAAVRIEGEYSDFKHIKRGVRQGCVMSPDLFNLYSETILRNLEDVPGLKVNGENLNNLRYADDTVLMAESVEQLQKLLDTVVLASEAMGLSLNVKKTECMVVSKRSSNPRCNLVSKGERIKQVTKFKYLGYLITSDGRCATEIRKRIAMAKDAFQKMKSILANRNITMTTKIRILKTYIWSVLLYGCECWTINKEIERKLEAAEMWLIRRMMRISWTDKRTNESVLKEANLERSLIKTLRRRQLEFLGHVCRHKGLEHVAITGKIEGKRSRGRQRITFIESLNSWSTNVASSNTFLKLTEDRSGWRSMIANVCSRQGT